MYNVIVVGSGFAGASVARLLADQGFKVLVIEKRKNVSGNMYDYIDKNGLMIHKYGPHILMSDSEEVYSFVSRYANWKHLCVNIEAHVCGKNVPLPINLNSIKLLYGVEQANVIVSELLNSYALDSSVNVLDLIHSENEIIKKFAKDIYDKVFVGYNAKMWGVSPLELDKNVIGRSPIRITYRNEKSNCKYQIIPIDGYYTLFKKMLSSENIDILLNKDATSIINIKDNEIYYDNKKFEGKVIWTAPLDELFNYDDGQLPYRAIHFKKKVIANNNLFESLAISFPQNYRKLRSSDMNRITNTISDKTAIIEEYSSIYDKSSKKFSTPSYPIINPENLEMIAKYKDKVKEVPNFYYIGRLAEYKYYDMNQVLQEAFRLVERLV